MPSRKPTTERLELPPEMIDMMERRTADLVRACMWEPNIILAIACSCYLQGCTDTLQLVEQKPGFVEEYLAVLHREPGYGPGV